MVVVDQSSGAKHAMMWALTHVANRGDFLTLLHVLPRGGAGEEASALANSLGSLCKACKPEVCLQPCSRFICGLFFQGFQCYLEHEYSKMPDIVYG
jgi:hypothetical protein